MNYFELFEMPISFTPDAKQVNRQFYVLSRRYHPDFFANGTSAEQAAALENSSQVNKGMRVLQLRDETIKYVLQLKGLLEEEEKYALPPEFLMEMMDLNEQVMEPETDNNNAAVENIKASINKTQSEIYAPVKNIIENYQEGVTTKEELLQVKDYYYKKKYLNRILAGMD